MSGLQLGLPTSLARTPCGHAQVTGLHSCSRSGDRVKCVKRLSSASTLRTVQLCQATIPTSRDNRATRSTATTICQAAETVRAAPTTPASRISDPPATRKPRVVVLGSGWGSVSFIKALPKKISDAYDITVLSPRNYFLFTALLPAACFGNVEEKSIIESIRRILRGKGSYYEAAATEIDVDNRIITAAFQQHAGLDSHTFKVPYDILIVSVGSVNNTFGIQGVREHTYQFKCIEDAAALRQRVCECFERAALPETSEQERQQLLSFVIVGGGPTGVEVAAELYDLIKEDLPKYYPALVPQARVRLVELQDHILSTYDRDISNYTSQLFQRNGVELVLNAKVQAVDRNTVTVLDKAGNTSDIPFGACVWATGVAIHPFMKLLQQKLPEQEHFRSIVTDDFLRVKGSNGSIYAMGDAATIDQPRALARAQELFHSADVNKDGQLDLAELRSLMRAASKEYSHLNEHARFLDSKYGSRRFGGLVTQTLAGRRTGGGSNGSGETCEGVMGGITEDTRLSEGDFEELLRTIDSGLRALPATGQVAGQQGAYLASLFKHNTVRPGQPLPPEAKPFKYNHLGSLAYVGGDKAVMDIPKFGPLKGYGAGLLWRGFETFRQISFRNQCLVASDWIKRRIFGRDVEFGRTDAM